LTGFEASLRSTVRPGTTIALGDGVGGVRTLDSGEAIGSILSRVARDFGGVRLILGWLPAPPEGLDAEAFQEVVALMPGWGVRRILGCPTAHFVPIRLSGIASLLRGPLRPDVLLTRLARRADGLVFGTEVSWQRELVGIGVPVLAVLDSHLPAADAAAPLEPTSVTVAGHSAEGPVRVPQKDPDPVHDALADAVLQFVPEGARLQYGPGQLGTALLRRSKVALHIDTGLLTDAVVDLDHRGLLIGEPSATYLLGTDTLYDWADGRAILRGIEHTHDLTRLSHGLPLVAVNTALEIDRWGQINVEGLGDKVIGGIGGHPDYCAAATMSRDGLSVIAVPSTFAGRSPLVDQLSRPASTPAYDIDLIVTESGHADLRGADWDTRRHRISALFK
jgi:hypothetical protein